MICPTIWEDPSFNKLSHSARLIFIGMFSNADDEGYLRSDAGTIKRLIFGFDDFPINDVEKCLAEVEQMRSIHLYQENGEKYAHFVKWKVYQKQQKDRIQPTSYPMCSKCVASDKQLLTEVSSRSSVSRERKDTFSETEKDISYNQEEDKKKL